MNTTTPNSAPDGVPPLNAQEMAWLDEMCRTSMFQGVSMNYLSLTRAIQRLKFLETTKAPVPPSDDTALLCKQLEALQRNVPLGQYGDVYSRAITDAIRLLTATDAGDRGELVAKLITAHDLMKEHAAGLVMKDDLEQAIRALSAPSTPSRAGGTEEKT